MAPGSKTSISSTLSTCSILGQRKLFLLIGRGSQVGDFRLRCMEGLRRSSVDWQWSNGVVPSKGIVGATGFIIGPMRAGASLVTVPGRQDKRVVWDGIVITLLLGIVVVMVDSSALWLNSC